MHVLFVNKYVLGWIRICISVSVCVFLNIFMCIRVPVSQYALMFVYSCARVCDIISILLYVACVFACVWRGAYDCACVHSCVGVRIWVCVHMRVYECVCVCVQIQRNSYQQSHSPMVPKHENSFPLFMASLHDDRHHMTKLNGATARNVIYCLGTFPCSINSIDWLIDPPPAASRFYSSAIQYKNPNNIIPQFDL